jgi:hypothetical protein
MFRPSRIKDVAYKITFMSKRDVVIFHVGHYEHKYLESIAKNNRPLLAAYFLVEMSMHDFQLPQ